MRHPELLLAGVLLLGVSLIAMLLPSGPGTEGSETWVEEAVWLQATGPSAAKTAEGDAKVNPLDRSQPIPAQEPPLLEPNRVHAD